MGVPTGNGIMWCQVLEGKSDGFPVYFIEHESYFGRAGLYDDESAAKRLESMANHHAVGRIGTSLEIAEGIEYLIRAEWVTGTVLSVDGGMGLGVISQ